MSNKIRVSSGAMINPVDLQPEDIDPTVAIHALSLLCRYGGQCRLPFMVAEHTVKLIEVVPPHLRKAALIHDFPEGLGLIDLPHPVKGQMPEYKAIDTEATRRVFARFDVPWEHMEELSTYDRRMCQDEMMQVFDEPFDIGLEPLGITVEFWDWTQAKRRLTYAARDLGVIA